MAMAQGFKESTKPAKVIRGKEISSPCPAKKQAGEVQELNMDDIITKPQGRINMRN